MKVGFIDAKGVAAVVVACAALSVQAKFIVDISSSPVVQVRTATVAGEAVSLLPSDKKWKLVWHDEFNGPEIDRTKWMCRESFWGADFPAFAHDFEGVEMTGHSVKLHLLRKGNDFSSPHLQTGSLSYDIPKDGSGFWPFGSYRKPLFMHKYGYYEIRCRQPKYPGWHSAFWLQAPGVGSSPNPGTCGVETDIMENYRQFTEGRIVGGNLWNGYGKDGRGFGHFEWKYEEYEDGWCYYGVDWSPKGYTFYANGKKIGEQNEPVSHVEQFILVSTEPRGYRNVGANDGGLTDGQRTWGKPDPKLFEVVLPDSFEVDFVRVYDAVENNNSCDIVLVPAPRKVETGSGAFRCRTADIASVVKFVKAASIPCEGYRLEVAPDAIRVWSSDDAGAFYAVRTLEQLARKTSIPDSQFADIKKRESDYEIPSVRIEDAPEFRWRGFMIDEARHFLGKEAVMRQIDLMADHKLNVFHWHLVDDQGWRLDLPRHPELVKYGAVRPCSVAFGAGAEWYGKEQTLGYRINSEKYGPFFYSPEDVREIREYARARHVTIVPEIEIPGHERALLAARPDLSCRGEEALERIPRIFWSIEKDVLCAGNDETVRYFEGLFDELCELFPDSPYIHIGGDECPKDRWKTCPKCQKRMKEIGAKDERELQAWFTRHFAEYLGRKGRRAVGWDEVLHGDVPQNVIGMSWRMSAEGGAGGDFVSASEAAVKGHDMVLTPSRYCYFSRRQGVSQDPFPYYEPEPFAEQKPKEDLTLEKAYGFDPYAGFSENIRHRILGVQASVWTESIFNRFDFEWKTWPRTCALAEIAWTGPGVRTFDDFRRRMLLHRRRLVSNLVNCAPIE